ncbi:MAG: hypothetical protein IPL28_12260 [Chloroflexi bacterium]|nr:hypothetical protein [Chloroflexota bacterium]
MTGDESFVESAKTFQEDTADIPDEEFVAAVPAQGLPVAIPSGVVLEIGQQYAVPDAPHLSVTSNSPPSPPQQRAGRRSCFAPIWQRQVWSVWGTS